MEAIAGTPEYQSVSKRPIRDAVLLGVAFLCIFTSFQALQNLQTSLHQNHGLGVASLAAIYGASFLISFFTPAIVFNVGIKSSILMAWVVHIIYVACNIWPSWFTLVPGSVLLGLGTCPLWTSVNTYISALARVKVDSDVAKTPRQITTVHAAFSQLNGLFHSIFITSQLTGNLISSLILFQSPDEMIAGYHYLPEATSCGAEYCLLSGQGKPVEPPETYIVYIMLGLFLAFDVTGLVITWKFTTNLQQPHYTGREVYRKLRSYWQAMFQPKFLLLIPLFAARGMNLTLHVGLFTEAYVSCALKMRFVGIIMAVWGGTTMLSSAFLGYAARFTGRQFLCGFAFFIDFAILMLLLLWKPHSGSVVVFVCVAALMGLVDGIWSVQCNALIAVLFPAIVDSAFSVSGTWHALSTSLSFILALYVCPAQRIYVAFTLVALALLGYVVVEVVHRRSLQNFSKEDDHQYMLVSSAGGIDDDDDDDVVEFRVAETSLGLTEVNGVVANGGRGGKEEEEEEEEIRDGDKELLLKKEKGEELVADGDV